MNTSSKIILTAVVAIAAVAAVAWAVDVDVTGDVEVPEVVADVDMRGGEMPDVDVETVDVDYETKQGEVEVPSDVEVDVETTEKTVPYPSFEVDKPEEDTYAEEDDLSMN